MPRAIKEIRYYYVSLKSNSQYGSIAVSIKVRVMQTARLSVSSEQVAHPLSPTACLMILLETNTDAKKQKKEKRNVSPPSYHPFFLNLSLLKSPLAAAVSFCNTNLRVIVLVFLHCSYSLPVRRSFWLFVSERGVAVRG